MAEIIIAGHKNPDTDSVCAAYCYASFKNTIDHSNKYVPVICGTIQAQARFVFSLVGLPPPEHIKDIRPRVVEVARNDAIYLNENDPVLDAASRLDERTLSIAPVFSMDNKFAGMVGLHEVSRYFVSGGLQERPLYTFSEKNIEKVVPGYFLKRGTREEFVSRLMIGAMAFESSIKRINDLLPDKPLLVVGNRMKIISYAVENDFPAIVLTGINDEKINFDFSGYRGSVYVSRLDTAETIRLLRLSVPIKHIMETSPPSFMHDELFDDAKKKLLSSDHRGLPVFTNGQYSGVVTRRSFIEKPRKKVILVDHNELSQSLIGMEDADVCEIIDHHRLGAEKTNAPIYIYSKPVGSTCTIIFEHYRASDIPVGSKIAMLLLSGIMSDTIGLRSPTTTPDDVRAAESLAKISNVTVEEYADLMLSRMPLLQDVDADQAVTADFKEYKEKNISVGIGQIEVASFSGIESEANRLLQSLGKIKSERGLDWAMLLVTNVTEERSVLFTTPFPAADHEISYKLLNENLFDLPDVLSRKKQLLPEILRVIEALSRK